MLLENAVVHVTLSGPRISCMYPWIFPVAGPSTPWKVTEPSPTASTVWLTCACEHRGYLQGELIVGVSILVGGTGGGLGIKHGGTTGVTLRGAWGSELPCSMGNGVVARVCLGGRVGVGVGASVSKKNIG